MILKILLLVGGVFSGESLLIKKPVIRLQFLAFT